MAADLRLGVLASGRGSNLAALLAARDRGDLTPVVALVVSNNSGAGALRLAREAGIAALHISDRTHADPGAALLSALREHCVDVLVLAGYMKRLDPRIVAAYAGRAVNIHPAPLPRFGGTGMFGERVHAAVLAAGVPTTGPTVHLVTDDYDEGEVLAHAEVPVLPGDTPASLADRVLAAEHDLYWRAIEARFGRAPRSA
jgi:phosphoribosylglycinamide formyltransferase-1